MGVGLAGHALLADCRNEVPDGSLYRLQSLASGKLCSAISWKTWPDGSSRKEKALVVRLRPATWLQHESTFIPKGASSPPEQACSARASSSGVALRRRTCKGARQGINAACRPNESVANVSAVETSDALTDLMALQADGLPVVLPAVAQKTEPSPSLTLASAPASFIPEFDSNREVEAAIKELSELQRSGLRVKMPG